MKKYLFIATALAALASCSDTEFIGDEAIREANENGTNAIVFGTGVNTMTRAALTGATAADHLNNNFVFMGTKGATPSAVFNNYQANYGENTANTTLSNSNSWEYVGYKNVPDGVTTDVGVVEFSKLTGSDEANKNAID